MPIDSVLEDDSSEGMQASGPCLLLKNDFLEALRADFTVHGADVIAACRADDPLQYVKLIASLLPKDGGGGRTAKEISPTGEGLAHLSDEELLARIRSLEVAIDASTFRPAVASEAGASTDGAQAADRHTPAAVLPSLR